MTQTTLTDNMQSHVRFRACMSCQRKKRKLGQDSRHQKRKEKATGQEQQQQKKRKGAKQ